MIVFRAAKDRVHVIAFSPDGATLAAGVPGGVSFWDLASGQEMKKLRPKENTRYLCPVYSLAFHPGGESLAAGGPELRLWDLRTGAAAILQG
ncbi:MAG TPA: hypothetical protein VIL46_16900, partial [Gemmataceae bacterium]